MGPAGSKPTTLFLSTRISLQRLSECVLPYDKEAILDYAEALIFNLRNIFTQSLSSRTFHKNHGVDIIFRLLTSSKSAGDEACFELLRGEFLRNQL